MQMLRIAIQHSCTECKGGDPLLAGRRCRLAFPTTAVLFCRCLVILFDLFDLLLIQASHKRAGQVCEYDLRGRCAMRCNVCRELTTDADHPF